MAHWHRQHCWLLSKRNILILKFATREEECMHTHTRVRERSNRFDKQRLIGLPSASLLLRLSHFPSEMLSRRRKNFTHQHNGHIKSHKCEFK
jgi:hypothetical protein